MSRELNLLEFPHVGFERKLYVRGLDPKIALELMDRGYVPIELATLARETADDQVLYLLAKAQAIEERTIVTDPEERKCLELEMRAYGLLDKKSMALSLNVNADADELDGLLGWGKSRHTLAENSTVLAANLPKKRGRQRRGKTNE